MKGKNKLAFTLVELLVVIAVIGLIATISVLALSSARAKSRDTKKLADTRQIKTSLELFFNDYGRYPTVEEWQSGYLFSQAGDLLMALPEVTNTADGDCTLSEAQLNYYVATDGRSYVLTTCLGGDSGSLLAGEVYVGPGFMGNEQASTAAMYQADENKRFLPASTLQSTQDAAVRDQKRLADIYQIKSAISRMYNDYGHYFDGFGWYDGLFYADDTVSTGVNCPYNDCPDLSDFCIKAETRIEYSYGEECDSGQVYLRNIPLNNYHPDNETGSTPYRVFYWDDFDGQGNNYLRLNYTLETSGRQSDHFINNQISDCYPSSDIGMMSGELICNESLMPQVDQQRLNDISVIETALNRMYQDYGYYLVSDGYSGYTGWSYYQGDYRITNCSIINPMDLEVNPYLAYDYSTIECPAVSGACLKVGYGFGESLGSDCDSGSVYLKNIPLNNYTGKYYLGPGVKPYHIFYYNNYNGSDDYLRVTYNLSDQKGGYSDHFFNGQQTNCVLDPDTQLVCP